MSYVEPSNLSTRLRALERAVENLQRTNPPAPHFQDLADAELYAITDGQVPMYDKASGLFKPGDVSGGGGGGGVLPAFWALRSTLAYSSMDNVGVGGKWVPWSSLYASTGVALADSDRVVSVPQGWYWVSVSVHINSINDGFDEIDARGPAGFTPTLGSSGADSASMAIIDTGPGVPSGPQFDWHHTMSGMVRCSASTSYLTARVNITNAAASFPFVTVVMSGHWVAELGDIEEA